MANSQNDGRGQITQPAPPKHDLRLDEILIYRLSNRLGGRSEVLNTPLVEAFKYLEMETQHNEDKRLADFLNMFYANPLVENKQRQKYMQSIMPKVRHSEPLEMKWDKEKLKRYKQSLS